MQKEIVPEKVRSMAAGQTEIAAQDVRSLPVVQTKIAPEMEISYAPIEQEPIREGMSTATWWPGTGLETNTL
jgi:hypothetical protein